MADFDELKTVHDAVGGSSLLPVLRSLQKQQSLIREALRVHDLRLVLDADQWKRMYDGFLSSGTFAATAGLSRQLQEVRAALAPIRIDLSAWDSEALQGVLAGMETVRQLAPAIGELEGLRQYRELTLTLSHLPRIDMSDLLPKIHIMDEALVRTTEIRAAIAMCAPSIDMPDFRSVAMLDGVSSAVADLWRGATLYPERWLDYPDVVRDVPALGLFEATRGTAALFEVDEPLLGGADAEDELALYDDDIAPRLAQLGTPFVDRYVGALEAMRRGDPDWFRHASVSMRELIIDLLRMYAPDDAVLRSNSDAPQDDSGTVTYRARIDYIFRVFPPDFARFFALDGEHIQQTIIALNKGTHSPAPPFNTIAQRSTVLRARFAVLYLVIAGES
ncbi:MAG: pPIWI-associating nuclease domain-containing protein [Longimicrobiales bacterium]